MAYPKEHRNDPFHSQLSAIKDSDVEILKNREILAINQDPVIGQSISPFRWGVNVCLFHCCIAIAHHF